eukprot:9502074-Pyramimonas_sp.AAC.1
MHAVPVPPQGQHPVWKGIPQNGFYKAWMEFPGQKYSVGTWPQHWNSKRKTDAEKYYMCMPEDFYNGSSLPVVTPLNALQWLHHVTPAMEVNELGHRLDIQEICSGSSRLSLAALHLRLNAGFPVDHRYGWDTGLRDHQHILDEIHDNLGISVQFFSPRCSPWSKANTTSKAETKARARQEERAGLQWTTYRCRQVLESKQKTRAFILETPH